jgi:hypothetical protein
VKQAFGRTLEEKGPRRLPVQLPATGKAGAGARTGSRAGGGRHFRNRSSLAASAASNSSFMLERVDEEDRPADADVQEAVSGSQKPCVPVVLFGYALCLPLTSLFRVGQHARTCMTYNKIIWLKNL